MKIQWNGEYTPDFKPQRGHKVSKRKTHIYFSPNTITETKTSIISYLGFQEVDHMGKYLDVSVLHSRMKVTDFDFIFDKFRGKLNGWAVRTLLLAGHVTLAKSVLSAIPTYFIQVMSFPKRVYDEIESETRRFIWGSEPSRRKISLVNWPTVCTPIDRGGLGLIRPLKQNKAFLMKLGNGDTINFWNDEWVPHLGPLYGYARADTHVHPTQKLHNFIDEQNHWDVEALSQVLVPAVIPHMLNIQPPEATNISDALNIWSIAAPQRVRMFIWLAYKEKIMTNYERGRRMLTNDCSYATCGATMESVIHVLHDYPPSQNLWLRVVPHSAYGSFFIIDLQSWITQNIQKQQPVSDGDPSWSSFYGSIWHIWKQMNDYVFKDVTYKTDSTIHSSYNWAKCYANMATLDGRGSIGGVIRTLMENELQIQFDCSRAVKLVGESRSIDNHIPLLRAILKLRQSGYWLTKIQWISRNGNKITDRMAKLASRQHYNLESLTTADGPSGTSIIAQSFHASTRGQSPSSSAAITDPPVPLRMLARRSPIQRVSRRYRTTRLWIGSPSQESSDLILGIKGTASFVGSGNFNLWSESRIRVLGEDLASFGMKVNLRLSVLSLVMKMWKQPLLQHELKEIHVAGKRLKIPAGVFEGTREGMEQSWTAEQQILLHLGML
ncbi:hypothetical protein F3Y22_tig00111719pilonHSYRG00029 [Hibiscus syriacus]|uniref:Reverse transcriptase zinc-binding domain-containing protein n=1 Tax=Hibiscus syriacus TaxID=106335 RepID=A0A6A2YI25_HIBSY|nr:hypothetical protein F3Y22_tig00111719pilonHSYRG00029 [Hibiscus syriacus]